MNSAPIIFSTVIAWIGVFAQSQVSWFRDLTGVQLEVGPSIMVYAGLVGNVWCLAGLSVLMGLGLDSLSMNPLGVSVLPLFVVGWLVNANRELLLRNESYAQLVLGIAATALASLMTLSMLVFVLGHKLDSPQVNWITLWQWSLSSVVGGLISPILFYCGEAAKKIFMYESAPENRFRGDREIKRWRV